MKIKYYIIIVFFAICGVVVGQTPMSKADVLFYEYAYQDAIREYKKEMTKAPLSGKQILNLADSYFNTGNYKGASDTYFEFYKKDSTMSSFHFNKMLQAMTKTSGQDRAKALLATRTADLSSELLENAEFNFELLSDEELEGEDFRIFNVDGNSPQSDFSPTFYKDRILFTSGRGNDKRNIYRPSGESYLDIYIAHVNEQGNILNPNPFQSLPDSKFHQATPYYSEDVGALFFVNSIEEEGEMI